MSILVIVKLIFGAVMSFPDLWANSCVLPSKASQGRIVEMPAGCSLDTLGIRSEKFVLVPLSKSMKDHDSGRRYVGIPSKGLVLQVSPEGQVYSAQQIKTWKQKEKILIFDELMAREFSKKQGYKKRTQ